MKRDMELCRRILLYLENVPYGTGFIKVEFDDIDSETIAYHLKLLDDAGLIEAKDMSSLSRLRWRVKSITWEGQDFLNAIKDETRWREIIDFAKKAGKILTLETLKASAKALFM